MSFIALCDVGEREGRCYRGRAYCLAWCWRRRIAITADTVRATTKRNRLYYQALPILLTRLSTEAKLFKQEIFKIFDKNFQQKSTLLPKEPARSQSLSGNEIIATGNSPVPRPPSRAKGLFASSFRFRSSQSLSDSCDHPEVATESKAHTRKELSPLEGDYTPNLAQRLGMTLPVCH